MIVTQIVLSHFITTSNIISDINDHQQNFIRLSSSLKSFFSISLPFPTSSQTSMIISRILFDYDHHSNHSFQFHYHFQHHLKHQWSSSHFYSIIIITQIILFNFITTSNTISNINDHHNTFIRLLSSLKSFFSISLPLPIPSQTSMIITTLLFDYYHHSNHSFPFHYQFQYHLKHQWSSSHFYSTMIITQIILFHFITNSNTISNINDHQYTIVRLWSSLKSFFSISLPLPIPSQTSMIITRILFDYYHHLNHSFPFHYHFQHHLKHQWSSREFCSTIIITQIILFDFITTSNIISNINDHENTIVRLWSSVKSFFSISLLIPTSSQTSMIITRILFDYYHHSNHSFPFHYQFQYHLKHQWSS